MSIPINDVAAVQQPANGVALTLVYEQPFITPTATITFRFLGAGDISAGHITVSGIDGDGNPQEETVVGLPSSTSANVDSVSTWQQILGISPHNADFSGYTLEVTTASVVTGLPAPAFNCECDDDYDYETYAMLRRRLLVRLGYAAQANTPPPGMVDLLNDFLQGSQRQLYLRYKELRTERFFTWTMTPGIRFYDIGDNDETCTKRLNALRITWAGISDINEFWIPMTAGIPPEYYTSVLQPGLPARYDIRQCIEVFPAPDRAYKMRFKGQFRLPSAADFDDTEQTAIDSELVFLYALANAKAHYGQADANNIAQEAKDYLGQINSGTHLTKRYVPGTLPLPSAPTPIFLPVGVP